MPRSPHLIYHRGVTHTTCLFFRIWPLSSQPLHVFGCARSCIAQAAPAFPSRRSHRSARSAGMSEPLAVDRGKAGFLVAGGSRQPSLHSVESIELPDAHGRHTKRDLADGRALLWDSGKVAGRATAVQAIRTPGRGLNHSTSMSGRSACGTRKDQVERHGASPHTGRRRPSGAPMDCGRQHRCRRRFQTNAALPQTIQRHRSHHSCPALRLRVSVNTNSTSTAPRLATANSRRAGATIARPSSMTPTM